MANKIEIFYKNDETNEFILTDEEITNVIKENIICNYSLGGFPLWICFGVFCHLSAQGEDGYSASIYFETDSEKFTWSDDPLTAFSKDPRILMHIQENYYIQVDTNPFHSHKPRRVLLKCLRESYFWHLS